jgi:hypothetical protein
MAELSNPDIRASARAPNMQGDASLLHRLALMKDSLPKLFNNQSLMQNKYQSNPIPPPSTSKINNYQEKYSKQYDNSNTSKKDDLFGALQSPEQAPYTPQPPKTLTPYPPLGMYIYY